MTFVFGVCLSGVCVHGHIRWTTSPKQLLIKPSPPLITIRIDNNIREGLPQPLAAKQGLAELGQVCYVNNILILRLSLRSRYIYKYIRQQVNILS